MFPKLFSGLFSSRDADLSRLEQPRIEALIDTLVFAMMADGHAADEEWAQLRSGIEEVPWQSEMLIEEYIQESIEELELHLKTQDDAREWVRSLGDRLDEDWLRKAAYKLAARVVCSDGQIDAAEQGLMSIMIREFGLNLDEAKSISAEVHREFGLL